ncbi:D-alanyl-D-alanine carboxypeptidase/D-alanyl-D-alanine-endopeptidase [Rhodobacteraceae bacterium WD3A24]|nr:D-alanyl-D-alanine carboxypeptidase/D-alanyl-D-alanine-endopeptidase [Rhodobacteraceae bacterium WD3A24]
MTRDVSRVSRRWVLGGLLGSAFTPAFAAAPLRSPRPVARPLPPAGAAERAARESAEAMIARAQLGGQVSFAVADTESGTLLEARAPDLGQPPASTIKALTACYGLEILGGDHRFSTRMIATGPLREDGRLDGDLVLVGGGDPTLDTDALGDMVTGLHAAGIRSVSGRFRIHRGALPFIAEIAPGQPPQAGYNPPVAGLNLNFNRVYFGWNRESEGYDVVMEARGAQYRPAVALSRMEVVDRAAPVYTYSREAGRDNWTVARQALGNGGARWLPVRRPGIYAAEVAQRIGAARGVDLGEAVVSDDAAVDGRVLIEHRSAPLREILRDMLRYSTNLTAEAVGLAATHARGGRPRTLAASARAMARWAEGRFGVEGLDLADHSGLADTARVSARAMAGFLVRAGGDARLRGLMREISLRDDRGRPIDEHPLTIAAKTGTLNFASGLVGYIAGPGGRDLAFAVFAANMERRAALPDAHAERPPGGRAWLGRARGLQMDMIERWGGMFIL